MGLLYLISMFIRGINVLSLGCYGIVFTVHQHLHANHSVHPLTLFTCFFLVSYSMVCKLRYSVIKCRLSYFSVYVTNRVKCNKIKTYTPLVFVVEKTTVPLC